MLLKQTIHINAPIEHVWSILCDITRWPDWTPTVTKIQIVSADPFRVGTKVKIYQPKLVPAYWTITDWKPGVGFIWQSKSFGVTTIAKHELTQTKKGVELLLSVEFYGLLRRFAILIAGKLTKEYLLLEANGLKRISEDELN